MWCLPEEQAFVNRLRDKAVEIGWRNVSHLVLRLSIFSGDPEPIAPEQLLVVKGYEQSLDQLTAVFEGMDLNLSKVLTTEQPNSSELLAGGASASSSGASSCGPVPKRSRSGASSSSSSSSSATAAAMPSSDSEGEEQPGGSAAKAEPLV